MYVFFAFSKRNKERGAYFPTMKKPQFPSQQKHDFIT